MIKKKYDKINLQIFDTRVQMGQEAAVQAANCIRKLLLTEREINCIFAAAPSQSEFLQNLCAQPNIDWSKVNAFHMDEYVGLPLGHAKSFNHFLTENIFSKLPFGNVFLINGANMVEEEIKRYSALLQNAPTHITFMGIGENGHIAFNDPQEADFQDTALMKKVKLDEVCRMQQVNDKCFDVLEDVPQYALTVTIPRLVSSKYIFCMVPGEKKHNATVATLTGPISTDCPASILRTTNNVCMYIDKDCAGEL